MQARLGMNGHHAYEPARDLTRGLVAAIRTSDGREPIDLSPLMRPLPDEQRFSVQSEKASDWAYWLLDITITEDGSLALIEANGSNGALNSIVNGGIDRVHSMVGKILDRLKTSPTGEGSVVLLLHGEKFHHLPEFIGRAITIAKELRSLGINAELCSLADAPNRSCVNVIYGALPEAADLITVEPDLTYRGLPITLIQNGNLIPELIRKGKCSKESDIDLQVFHEGLSVSIANDKGIQQSLCEGTDFLELHHAKANSKVEFIDLIKRALEPLPMVVLKPNAASQGIGVTFVKRGDNVHEKVATLLRKIREGYGSNAELTGFPLRLFEWVKASPITHHGGNPVDGHLWDLRVEVLVSPGEITVTPVVVRVCPRPYRDDDPSNEEALKSNLSGRKPTTQFMVSPDDIWSQLGDHDLSVRNAALQWAKNAIRHVQLMEKR